MFVMLLLTIVLIVVLYLTIVLFNVLNRCVYVLFRHDLLYDHKRVLLFVVGVLFVFDVVFVWDLLFGLLSVLGW